jgi:hypothetical protein
LLSARAQNLTIRGCTFQGTVPLAQASEQAAAAVVWEPADAQDHSGGLITIRDSVFSQTGSAFTFAGLPRQVDMENCLHLGPGSLASLRTSPTAGRDLKLILKHVTLRQAAAVLRWQPPGKTTSSAAIAVAAQDCVFDLAGPNAAVFQLATAEQAAPLLPHLRLEGEGTLANPDVVIAAWTPPGAPASETKSLDAGFDAIEGLLPREFQFAGPFSTAVADAQVVTYQGPRRSQGAPGIDAQRLPIL